MKSSTTRHINQSQLRISNQKTGIQERAGMVPVMPVSPVEPVAPVRPVAPVEPAAT